jgi:hypothetical protein
MMAIQQQNGGVRHTSCYLLQSRSMTQNL